MRRGLWHCRGCERQISVLAGTVFQDTHLPLTVWFRAMWHMTSQKNGISALGLQRVLGLGSYRTAWMMLHKLRRAMVRPGRDRLQGLVEVDESYWGAHEEGVRGRQTEEKALIAVVLFHFSNAGSSELIRGPSVTSTSKTTWPSSRSVSTVASRHPVANSFIGWPSKPCNLPRNLTLR